MQQPNPSQVKGFKFFVLIVLEKFVNAEHISPLSLHFPVENKYLYMDNIGFFCKEKVLGVDIL